MVKRLTQWHPREGLGRDEAFRYWTEQHAKLLTDVPGLRGYVQNVCTLAPDGSEPPYAGLGEVWFDSVQAAEVAGSAEVGNGDRGRSRVHGLLAACRSGRRKSHR